MDAANLILLLAFAAALPALLVLGAVVAEHGVTGPFLRRHVHSFAWAAAALAAVSLVLRWQDPEGRAWLGVVTSMLWLAVMVALAISRRPSESPPS